MVQVRSYYSTKTKHMQKACRLQECSTKTHADSPMFSTFADLPFKRYITAAGHLQELLVVTNIQQHISRKGKVAACCNRVVIMKLADYKCPHKTRQTFPRTSLFACSDLKAVSRILCPPCKIWQTIQESVLKSWNGAKPTLQVQNGHTAKRDVCDISAVQR